MDKGELFEQRDHNSLNALGGVVEKQKIIMKEGAHKDSDHEEDKFNVAASPQVP
jgi:hypothetical protein